MLSQSNQSLINKQHDPFFIFYPEKLAKQIKIFKNNFKGDIIYAVKANPSNCVLEKLNEHGIKSFDVASLKEVKIIRRILPNANIFFMNTVKSRHSIKESYFKYGVRNFALDSYGELEKILDETNFAKDLKFHLRISIPNNHSIINLSRKFGIDADEAPLLLKKIRKYTKEIGLSFHVGSQCIKPLAYKLGIRIIKNVIEKSKINIKFLNIGGGFPSSYPGYKKFSLNEYFEKIYNEFLVIKNSYSINLNLFCEPGRSIVANCMSLVVKVELRKQSKLFINDGVHGSLNNAGYLNFVYPTKLFNREDKKSRLEPFCFYGPTCDSSDFMKGPFYLPSTVNEGDWIEILKMGAYSITMKSDFNGFFSEPKIFSFKNDKLIKVDNSHNKILLSV